MRPYQVARVPLRGGRARRLPAPQRGKGPANLWSSAWGASQKRWPDFWRAALVAVAGSAFCRLASAQAPIDLYQFEPPPAPYGALYLEPTSTPGPGAWNVGAVGSYGYRLITARTDQGEQLPAPLRHRVGMDYVASLGLGERVAVGWVLPSVLYQRGHDSPEIGVPAPTQTALGDARLSLKTTLVRPDPMGGTGLAAWGAVSVPTGDGSAYVGDEAASAQLRLLGELKLLILDIQASAGVHVRSKERVFGGERYGHGATWGLGVNVMPQALGLTQQGGWLATAEAHGKIAVTPELASRSQSFAVFGVSVRYQMSDLALRVGCELPIAAGVGTPLVRGVLGVGWAPRVPDQDGDGIPDDEDPCVDLPEDLDGFQDSDGCPDFDNDDDGSPDVDDRCPHEKEDEDGFRDEDGCIDPDNDADGVLDVEDACPDQRGVRCVDPKRSGCPEQKPRTAPAPSTGAPPDEKPPTPPTDTPASVSPPKGDADNTTNLGEEPAESP